ncbi:MAG: outer membrane protein [Alphaproteobacteria bacterium]
MKNIVNLTIAIIISLFFVFNASAQSQTTKRGSKALDNILKMKGATNEDVTDKYQGTFKYDEKTGEYTVINYNKESYRNHYWYLEAQAGITTNSAYDMRAVFGRHMRGVNLYAYVGGKQMKYTKEGYNLDPTAMQFGGGVQLEFVSLFFGHSRWQAAVGPEFGANNVSYKVETAIGDYRYRDVYKGFAMTLGGAANVEYKVTESFSVGAFARYSTYKVSNDRENFTAKTVSTDKLQFNDFSVGVSLKFNINVKL